MLEQARKPQITYANPDSNNGINQYIFTLSTDEYNTIDDQAYTILIENTFSSGEEQKNPLLRF